MRPLGAALSEASTETHARLLSEEALVSGKASQKGTEGVEKGLIISLHKIRG
jgi:hypothetical protein